MKLKSVFIVLAAILVLSALLRLFLLGGVPPSPDWDEVAIGYDAYSIIHNGRDQFGKFLPVVLRSFDDYKPALYAYLTIPSIIVFGLNTFAVRFPSAVSGIFLVLVVFYLIRELFKDYKYRDQLSLLTALFLGISPWSIQFSRVGFESNVGVLINATMVLFFLKGLKNHYFLYLAATCAGLGQYIYQSDRVFTPLLALLLVAIYWKKLVLLPKKSLIISVVLGIIVVLPMVFYIFTDSSALLRVKGTSVFSYQTEILKNEIPKIERNIQNKDYLGLILNNRRVVYAKAIVAGYLSHFDPNWLFIRGDIARHHAPNFGLLYLFELPLILIGIYFLLFGKFDPRTKILLSLWFLAVPIPASITTGVPHAVRTLNFLPLWQIFAAIGSLVALHFLSNLKFKVLSVSLKYLIYPILAVIVLFNISYYFNQYFVQLNYYDSADWQYGYKQAIDVVKAEGHKYKKIVISDVQPMDKSYMFLLFYLGYDPIKYQEYGAKTSGAFNVHQAFDKYEFRSINWAKDSHEENVLYIGNPSEVPEKGAPVIKRIKFLNGKPAIIIAGT
ncbi:MAG: hypothetical protein A2776_01945 [Candidatus Levybacteria bacterium RIFCSPHIGHO2_01_FULL_40_10]|nr:MAG: hypothetical protein A2776_01945 [Candidatus Levybacteria bacterium RIFCSPHIGHO2_01_FULL_40_10]